MQLHLVNRQILEADRRVLAWHRSNEASRRLDRIPGIGPLIATALVASIPNPQAFKSGRDLAAWIGLVPSRIRAAARTGSAASPSMGTATCGRC
jgi:transposase